MVTQGTGGKAARRAGTRNAPAARPSITRNADRAINLFAAFFWFGVLAIGIEAFLR